MEPLDLRSNERLSLFRRQYLQLFNLDSLAFPDPEYLRVESFQDLLYDSIFKPGGLAYPPNDRYQLRVLKELVLRVEQSITNPEEDELSDKLLSRLSTLLTSPLQPELVSAQQKSYVTYTLPVDPKLLQQQGEPQPTQDEATVTLLESRTLISGSSTTGLRTWEAALHLGTYLWQSPEGRDLVRGKNVLELGAGTGFLSILCAKYLGSSQVLATDGDPAVVEAIETNFFLNGLHGGSKQVGASVLKWGWTLMGRVVEGHDEGHEWDVVIGADVTYDPAVVPYLVSTLKDLFDKFPTVDVLISATIRNAETFGVFTLACRASKFITKDITFQPAPPAEQQGLFYSTAMPIHILRISRPSIAEDPWAV
ncbi:hypothetical protein GP486_001729 [Trichoglossum hirsutum]|uniref:Uncharacterized protein n=1 Tax=Trichoglossum hirsutum TaxID=265104 RepID=A0A9P8LGD0_9PEZI|nr:hypothetical protein GP486_001729 [Trichoglossum hirsutum]